MDRIGFPEKCLLGKRGALGLAPAQVAARCLERDGHGRKGLVVNRKWMLQARGAVQVGSSRDPRAPEWGGPDEESRRPVGRVRWRPRPGCGTGVSKGSLAPAGGCGAPPPRAPSSWNLECPVPGKDRAENTGQRHKELRALSSGKWEAALKEYLKKICCHNIKCVVCHFL